MLLGKPTRSRSSDSSSSDESLNFSSSSSDIPTASESSFSGFHSPLSSPQQKEAKKKHVVLPQYSSRLAMESTATYHPDDPSLPIVDFRTRPRANSHGETASPKMVPDPNNVVGFDGKVGGQRPKSSTVFDSTALLYDDVTLTPGRHGHGSRSVSRSPPTRPPLQRRGSQGSFARIPVVRVADAEMDGAGGSSIGGGVGNSLGSNGSDMMMNEDSRLAHPLSHNIISMRDLRSRSSFRASPGGASFAGSGHSNNSGAVTPHDQSINMLGSRYASQFSLGARTPSQSRGGSQGASPSTSPPPQPHMAHVESFRRTPETQALRPGRRGSFSASANATAVATAAGEGPGATASSYSTVDKTKPVNGSIKLRKIIHDLDTLRSKFRETESDIGDATFAMMKATRSKLEEAKLKAAKQITEIGEIITCENLTVKASVVKLTEEIFVETDSRPGNPALMSALARITSLNLPQKIILNKWLLQCCVDGSPQYLDIFLCGEELVDWLGSGEVHSEFFQDLLVTATKNAHWRSRLYVVLATHATKISFFTENAKSLQRCWQQAFESIAAKPKQPQQPPQQSQQTAAAGLPHPPRSADAGVGGRSPRGAIGGGGDPRSQSAGVTSSSGFSEKLQLESEYGRTQALSLMMAHPAVFGISFMRESSADKQTVLSRAARDGEVGLIAKILSRENQRQQEEDGVGDARSTTPVIADVNAPNSDHSTPLMQAVVANQKDVVRLLLRWKGLDLYVTHPTHGTALDIALKREKVIDIDVLTMIKEAYRKDLEVGGGGIVQGEPHPPTLPASSSARSSAQVSRTNSMAGSQRAQSRSPSRSLLLGVPPTPPSSRHARSTSIGSQGNPGGGGPHNLFGRETTATFVEEEGGVGGGGREGGGRRGSTTTYGVSLPPLNLDEIPDSLLTPAELLERKKSVARQAAKHDGSKILRPMLTGSLPQFEKIVQLMENAADQPKLIRDAAEGLARTKVNLAQKIASISWNVSLQGEEEQAMMIQILQYTIQATDRRIGSVDFLHSVLTTIVGPMNWAEVCVERNWLVTCAKDTSGQFLELLLSLPDLPNKLPTSQLVEITRLVATNKTLRIPMMKILLVAGAAAMNLEERGESGAAALNPVFQDFFADVASSQRALPREDRKYRLFVLQLMLKHKNINLDFEIQDTNHDGGGRVVGGDGLTILCRAADEGDIVLLRMLLENKNSKRIREIDQLSSDKRTPLICAVLKGHCAAVELLVRLGGADPDFDSGYHGGTALVIAVNGKKKYEDKRGEGGSQSSLALQQDAAMMVSVLNGSGTTGVLNQPHPPISAPPSPSPQNLSLLPSISSTLNLTSARGRSSSRSPRGGGGVNTSGISSGRGSSSSSRASPPPPHVGGGGATTSLLHLDSSLPWIKSFGSSSKSTGGDSSGHSSFVRTNSVYKRDGGPLQRLPSAFGPEESVSSSSANPRLNSDSSCSSSRSSSSVSSTSSSRASTAPTSTAASGGLGGVESRKRRSRKPKPKRGDQRLMDE